MQFQEKSMKFVWLAANGKEDWMIPLGCASIFVLAFFAWRISTPLDVSERARQAEIILIGFGKSLVYSELEK